MEIVITMAGLGSRFKEAGYNEPKYMIQAKGRTLFAWSMESLGGYGLNHRYHFIVRAEDHAGEFIRKECAALGIESFEVIEIDYVTDGQATTAMLAAPSWDREEELLIYNIDTYVERGQMNDGQLQGDGFIPCFCAPGDHWSFVKLNDSGNATEVREKERISDHCTLGAYYFKTCGLYETLYREFYEEGRCRRLKGAEGRERYVAPLYNYLITKGGVVRICDIDPGYVHVLGTPEELKVFLNE